MGTGSSTIRNSVISTTTAALDSLSSSPAPLDWSTTSRVVSASIQMLHCVRGVCPKMSRFPVPNYEQHDRTGIQRPAALRQRGRLSLLLQVLEERLPTTGRM